MQEISAYVAHNLGGTLDGITSKRVRDIWEGPMVIKGIMHPDDAVRLVDEVGVEGIQVSNHGGRQLDGAAASIDILPVIAEKVGDRATIIFDSGVRTGLDIIRALALGADFVMLGRAFITAVGAFGDAGGDHVSDILISELKNDMQNLGVCTIKEVQTLEQNGFFHETIGDQKIEHLIEVSWLVDWLTGRFQSRHRRNSRTNQLTSKPINL